jgi:hypothetical protein
MVEESKKLLRGWKHPLYMPQWILKNDNIVNVLEEEGVPRNLMCEYDNSKLEAFDFVGNVLPHQPDEFEISMITNLQRSGDGTLQGYSSHNITTIPLTKEAWFRQLHI